MPTATNSIARISIAFMGAWLDGAEPGARWSARSVARTNDLAAGEHRHRMAPGRRPISSSRSKSPGCAYSVSPYTRYASDTCSAGATDQRSNGRQDQERTRPRPAGRKAVEGVGHLPFSWNQHPDRGSRAYIFTETGGNACLVVLYPAVGRAADVWNLGSVYAID